MITIVQDLSFLIILVICVITKIYEIKNGKKIIKNNYLINKYSDMFFIIIFTIFMLSVGLKIGDLPKELHVDEAGAFYDAICLSEYGVDRYQNKLPVYLINFGGGQSALYAYLAGILMKIFGASVEIFRLPSVLLSLISCIFLYKTVKENNSPKEALLTTLIFAIVPWNIMKSRWGLDCNLMSAMITISICVFIIALNRHKNYLYVISGILFGLTLYTYVISYMVLPAILAILIGYMLIIKKIKIKNIICMGLPLAILALPLILMIAYNSGWIQSANLPIVTIPKLWFFRGGEISIQNIPGNLKNIFDVLFIKDFLNYNAIHEFGTLYKMSIPLVIFGVLQAIQNVCKEIKKKEISLDFVMLTTFVVMLVIGLCIAELNINKLNAIYIPMIYFAGRFLGDISENTKYLSIGVVIIYCLNYGMFMNYYFTQYSNIDLMYSESDIIEVSKKAEELDKEEIYIENCLNQTYIYPLVATPISPYEFTQNLQIENGGVTQYSKYKFWIPQEINENAAYIIKNDAQKIEQLQQAGFKHETHGQFTILWYE